MKTRPRENKAALLRFTQDHAWLLVLWALCVALPTAFFLLYGGSPSNAAYCICLAAILLAVCLAARFYTLLPLYRLENAAAALAGSPGEASKAAFDVALHRVKHSRSARVHLKIAEALDAHYSASLQRASDNAAQREAMMLRWVHHAKTPLSVMSLIADAHPENEDFRLVSSSTSELKRSLDQLLQIARTTDMASDIHIDHVNLANAAAACVKRFKGYFVERGVFASFEGSSDIFAFTDAKWLGSILDQLVSNAVKYSDEGSTVCLSCETAQGKPRLRIEDSGCGIAIEDLPRIFDAFFTGRNGRSNQESTGIGLYLAKTTADTLGIELRAESREGEGATFVLDFPSHTQT